MEQFYSSIDSIAFNYRVKKNITDSQRVKVSVLNNIDIKSATVYSVNSSIEHNGFSKNRSEMSAQ